jgi:hypothetical protein
MSLPDLINTAGVTLILAAYVLSQAKKIDAAGWQYALLNLTGAGLACYGSYLISAWPFVVLEGIWSVVSLLSLIQFMRRTNVDIDVK